MTPEPLVSGTGEMQPYYLAWPCGSSVTAGFMHSIVGLLMHPDREWIGHVSQISAGPLLTRTRNEIVSRFLASGLPWLLQIDSDMVFRPEDVRLLVESADPERAPIVGGAYVLPTPTGPRLAAGTWRDGFGTFDWPERMADLPDADDGGLVPIHYTGAGFLLTHRSVMESIPEPFDYLPGGVGEDTAFCMRAIDAGFPVYLNPAVRVGHQKTEILIPT